MLFNSVEFLLFLPVVFALYWFVFKPVRWQNVFMVAASYVFYGWWDARFLVLIFVTTLCSYATGLLMERLPRLRRPALWGAVVLNLGILALFKYYDFFAESFARLMALAGWETDSVTLGLILPVGISFYTFQALSYCIDVYRGRIGATKDAPAFFAFISFFPQLVAGPIERATNLLPQFVVPRNFNYGRAVEGMRLILWGLFKKMVVADNAATIVNEVFADYSNVGTANLWIGAALFSFQIYCDFSGYSDIAIGTARLFGIELMRNFRLPYFSRDIAEFWRRWHISLTTWFRDYVYIPLGGSRRGRRTTVRNTLVVFLTSGLWHGANFTFIAWGAYHALLFLPLILTGKNRRYASATDAPGGWLPPFGESVMMGLTFLLVMVGWVIFRADHLGQAIHYIGLMFSHYTPAGRIMGKTALAWCAVMVAAEWLTRFRETPLDLPERGLWRYGTVRMAVYAVLFLVVLVFAGGAQEFIYFKF